MALTPNSSIAYEGRGSLAGADPAVQREISKLWTNFETMNALSPNAIPTADHVVVTQGQLKGILAGLTKKGGGTVNPTTALSGGSVSTSSGSSGTPPITYTYPTVVGAAAMLFQSFNTTAPITIGSTTATLLNNIASLYAAVVDIEKTTDNSQINITPFSPTGQYGLFLQHLVAGATPAGWVAQNAGIRTRIETTQTGVLGSNNAMGLWADVNNLGSNCTAIALFGEALAGPTGGLNNQTFGCLVNVGKGNNAGGAAYVSGVVVQASNYGSYTIPIDYGFVLAPFGAVTATYLTGIALGSKAFGPVTCDVGIDLGYCNMGVAMIIPVGAPIAFSNAGPTQAGSYATVSSDVSGNLNFTVGRNGASFLAGQFTPLGTGGMQIFGGMAVNGPLSCGPINSPQIACGPLSATTLTLTNTTISTTGTIQNKYASVTINGAPFKLQLYA